jgi:hypothetical protein
MNDLCGFGLDSKVIRLMLLKPASVDYLPSSDGMTEDISGQTRRM